MFARFGLAVFPVTAFLVGAPACSRNPPPAYDSPPVLANREEITAAMRAVGAGLEARVVLHLRVDEKGYVRDVRIADSSGLPELDDAALWIGEQMRFEPARYEGKPVAAWVEVPVTFDVVSRVVRAARLRNAEEVAAIMARDYPDLRGTARLRVQVGAEGWAKEIQERRPYDRDVMRAARELIEERIKFWPAYKGGRQVATWVNLTVEFAGPKSRVYIDKSET
jgi:TonB family protein